MFLSAKAYCSLLETHHVHGDELLFVNSIASQYMNRDESIAYNEQFGFLQKRIAVEITVEDSPDLTALEKKRNMPGFSGKFALDDYGSGMMIIAEGLETPIELEKVLELEVDLLQGYFLAKPSAIPMPASEASVLVIESSWKQHK